MAEEGCRLRAAGRDTEDGRGGHGGIERGIDPGVIEGEVGYS
jgi:hypothetical protein